MFENLLIWLLERLYPKQEELSKPMVAVNVSQKQTVKKAVTRTVKRTPAKGIVAAKKTVKKAVKK